MLGMLRLYQGTAVLLGLAVGLPSSALPASICGPSPAGPGQPPPVGTGPAHHRAKSQAQGAKGKHASGPAHRWSKTVGFVRFHLTAHCFAVWTAAGEAHRDTAKVFAQHEAIWRAVCSGSSTLWILWMCV